MRPKEVVMKKNKDMMKALTKFIKEGKEPSPPKSTIISKPPFPANLNPLNLDFIPLQSFGEIEVNSDAMPPIVEENCKENEDVHEPITIEEQFNEEHIDAISVAEPAYVEDLMCV